VHLPPQGGLGDADRGGGASAGAGGRRAAWCGVAWCGVARCGDCSGAMLSQSLRHGSAGRDASVDEMENEDVAIADASSGGGDRAGSSQRRSGRAVRSWRRSAAVIAWKSGEGDAAEDSLERLENVTRKSTRLSRLAPRANEENEGRDSIKRMVQGDSMGVLSQADRESFFRSSKGYNWGSTSNEPGSKSDGESDRGLSVTAMRKGQGRLESPRSESTHDVVSEQKAPRRSAKESIKARVESLRVSKSQDRLSFRSSRSRENKRMSSGSRVSNASDRQSHMSIMSQERMVGSKRHSGASLKNEGTFLSLLRKTESDHEPKRAPAHVPKGENRELRKSMPTRANRTPPELPQRKVKQQQRSVKVEEIKAKSLGKPSRKGKKEAPTETPEESLLEAVILQKREAFTKRPKNSWFGKSKGNGRGRSRSARSFASLGDSTRSLTRKASFSLTTSGQSFRKSIGVMKHFYAEAQQRLSSKQEPEVFTGAIDWKFATPLYPFYITMFRHILEHELLSATGSRIFVLPEEPKRSFCMSLVLVQTKHEFILASAGLANMTHLLQSGFPKEERAYGSEIVLRIKKTRWEKTESDMARPPFWAKTLMKNLMLDKIANPIPPFIGNNILRNRFAREAKIVDTTLGGFILANAPQKGNQGFWGTTLDDIHGTTSFLFLIGVTPEEYEKCQGSGIDAFLSLKASKEGSRFGQTDRDRVSLYSRESTK